MTLELINPEDLPTPHTYTHVAVATGGRLCSWPARNPKMQTATWSVSVTEVGEHLAGLDRHLIEVEAIAVVDA